MTNAQWLAARMHGPSGKIPYTVGGSDVAAVFGVSPWTTPLELWMIKKGQMKPPAKSNANQLEMGHLLEPIAAHWYAKKTGNRVYEDTNLYQHADHPYALANFDRRFERASDGELGILECKSCTYSYIIAANTRKGGRELVLPAALGHISLCENQFCIYDLHSSVSDAVHLSDPFHLVAGFQFFRNSLCICRLFCKPKKKFLCLSVNIRKIYG